MKMISILLVEDNVVVRQILSDMMHFIEDLEVIAAAENGFAALELLENGLKPDIALVDINMPGMDGIKLTENLTADYGYLKVIVLTMHAKTAYRDRAMAAGARGYLLKNGDMKELGKAVRMVYAGELFIGEDVEN